MLIMVSIPCLIQTCFGEHQSISETPSLKGHRKETFILSALFSMKCLEERDLMVSQTCPQEVNGITITRLCNI